MSLIKAEYDGDLRLVEVPETTFECLRHTVQNVFGVRETRLQYLDEEGDWISMDTTEEFHLGLRLVQHPMRVRVRGVRGSEEKHSPSVALVEAVPVVTSVAATPVPYSTVARRLRNRGVNVSPGTLSRLMESLRLGPKRFLKAGLITGEELNGDADTVEDDEDLIAEEEHAPDADAHVTSSPPVPVMDALRAQGLHISAHDLHRLMAELRIRPKRFVKAGLVPKHVVKIWNQMRNSTDHANDAGMTVPSPSHPWALHHHSYHHHHPFHHMRHNHPHMFPGPPLHCSPRPPCGAFHVRPPPVSRGVWERNTGTTLHRSFVEEEEDEEIGWGTRTQGTLHGRSNRLKARFVAHLTLPDKTRVRPRSEITKVWRVRNDHTEQWPPTVQLVPIGACTREFGAVAAVNVPGCVGPGETVDLCITLQAPSLPGMYEAFFRLCDGRPLIGKRFGQRLWLSLIVAEDAPVSRSDEAAEEKTNQQTLHTAHTVAMGAFDNDEAVSMHVSHW